MADRIDRDAVDLPLDGHLDDELNLSARAHR